MKNILAAITIALLTPFSTSIFADEGFPDGTLVALEGVDAVTGAECFLFITDVGYTGVEKTPDQFFAKVLTGYSHGGDQPEALTLAVQPNRSDVLFGEGANGKDQIAVMLNSPVQAGDTAEKIFGAANLYNFKWWHSTHFDTFRCQALRIHDHDHD